MHDAFHDDGPPISRLHAAVRSLEAFVHAVVPPAPASAARSDRPPPTAELSPVQRFRRQDIAASRWKELAKCHVAVFGLGGVGALAADALVRMGVARVLLVDALASTTLDWSGLGRMGFYPDDVGGSRLQALRLRLQSIHTGVSVDSFAMDWASDADVAELCKRLKASSTAPTATTTKLRQRLRRNQDDGDDELSTQEPPAENEEEENDTLGLGLFEALTQRQPYDVVLSCLEDDSERLVLNQICLELSLPLLHVGLSPCNTKFFIRTVLPGHTCCLECIESLPGQEQQSNTHTLDQVAKSIARAFPASLPHVEMMAGGMLAQHTVKLLLEIGDFVPFVAVNALTFEMESFAFPPNRACTNATCQERQEEEIAAAAKYGG